MDNSAHKYIHIRSQNCDISSLICASDDIPLLLSIVGDKMQFALGASDEKMDVYYMEKWELLEMAEYFFTKREFMKDIHRKISIATNIPYDNGRKIKISENVIIIVKLNPDKIFVIDRQQFLNLLCNHWYEDLNQKCEKLIF